MDILEELIKYQTLNPRQCEEIYRKTQDSTMFQMLLIEYQNIDSDMINNMIEWGISEGDYEVIDSILYQKKVEPRVVDNIIYNNAWYWSSDCIFEQDLSTENIDNMIEYLEDVIRAEEEYFPSSYYHTEFSDGVDALDYIYKNYANEQQKRDIDSFHNVGGKE